MKRILATALAWLALSLPAAAGELERAFFENRFEDAADAAAVKLKHAPGDVEAQAVLAIARMKQGAFAEARALLAKLPADAVPANLARGDLAWYTGDWAEAHARFAQARRAGGGFHAAWGEASAVLHLGRWDEAERQGALLVQDAAGLGPTMQAWALVVEAGAKGYRLQTENPFQQAAGVGGVKAAFERAAKLDPTNANALSALGRFYLLAPPLLGRDEKLAVSTLEKANNADPFFFLNHAWLIRAHLAAKEPAKARAEAVYYRAKFQGLPAAEAELKSIALP